MEAKTHDGKHAQLYMNELFLEPGAAYGSYEEMQQEFLRRGKDVKLSTVKTAIPDLRNPKYCKLNHFVYIRRGIDGKFRKVES